MAPAWCPRQESRSGEPPDRLKMNVGPAGASYSRRFDENVSRSTIRELELIDSAHLGGDLALGDDEIPLPTHRPFKGRTLLDRYGDITKNDVPSLADRPGQFFHHRISHT